MLAVDGHQLGTRRRPQRLHDRPGGDQALLVGQGQALAGAPAWHRDRQAGEPDDPVDDHVGVVDEVGEVVDDLANGSAAATSARRAGSPTATTLRPELLGLLDEDVDGRRRRRARRPRSGGASARTTSSVCVPIDPDDPAMATRRRLVHGASVQGSSTQLR